MTKMTSSFRNTTQPFFLESSIKPVVRLTSSGGGGHKAVQGSWFEEVKELFCEELHEKFILLMPACHAVLNNRINKLCRHVKKIDETNELEKENFSRELIALLCSPILSLEPPEKMQRLFEHTLKLANYINQMRKPDLDVLTDSVSLGFIGKWLWDFSQRHEYVWIQQTLLAMQSFSNFLSNRFIYNRILNCLNEKNPAYIIDTQPMGTKAICQAVLAYNKRHKTNVRIKKYCTDMPTLRSVHFFNDLKALNDEERDLIDLQVLPPLTKSHDDNDDETFWQHVCGNNIELIRVNSPDIDLRALEDSHQKKVASGMRVYQLEHPNHWPIRKPFKAFKTESDYAVNRQALEKIGLVISLDKTFNYKAAKHQGLFATKEQRKQKNATVKINQDDTVISLMLGSNGGSSLLDYVEAIKEKVKEESHSSSDKKLHLFVFCGRNQEVQDKILSLLKEDKDTPPNLCIYPLGFQSGEAIAKVGARSEVIVTRSGGTATMEAMAVCHYGKILVHSQETLNKKQLATLSETEKEKHLLRAIPVWEGGNANYIRRRYQAISRIVNPQTILSYLDLSLNKHTHTHRL